MINAKYYQWILIGLSILFFFPFLGQVHLFDWDEINFAESAREMIATGDYYRVRINFDPFWEKPPFFFWLQVLSMKVFGINEFAARFPNALFGVITILTLFKIGKKLFTPSFGFIWGLLYLGSFLPHLYFKSGIIDPVFNLFIFLSIYFLALNIKELKKKKLNALLGGFFIGLAIITKGPVGLLLVLLTFGVYLIYNRFKTKLNISDIFIYAGAALIVTSTWFGYEVIQNGPWFIVEFIKYQIELFSQPVAGHEQPFYYHFVVVLLGCFPLSILALGGFKKPKNETPIDFLKWSKILFWIVLILFSIVKTKIVHYSSMTYLPLSFIATYYLYSLITNKRSIHKYTQWVLIFIGIIFSTLLVLAPILFHNKTILAGLLSKDAFALASLNIDMGWTGWEFLCGLIYPIGIAISFWLLYKKKSIQTFILSLCLFAGITLLSYSIFVVPKIEKFSQGPAIDFFKEKANENAYITTIGHKSYAHYFYSKVKECKEDDKLATIKSNYINSLEKKEDFNVIELNTLTNNWLLSGDIDKTAYFVTKINRRNEMKQHKKLNFMYNKGGFDFYKRTNK